MINIKKLFNKSERGLRKEKVKVTRDGKTFYREQMVGRKEGEKKEIPKSKYGFKTNLTESEIKDRKRLGKLMIEADREIREVKDDPAKYKEYRIASEKYRTAQEELYNKYGVY